MLSAADAEVVRRDPNLPGLAMLLDPEALAATLKTALPTAKVNNVRPTYVRYKPGTSCLVAYRLRMAEREIDFYAKAFNLAATQNKVNKDRRYQRARGTLGIGALLLEDIGLVIYDFPYDRRLKGLDRLVKTDLRRRLLSKLLPNRPDLWEATLRSLRYKPERRYVAQLRGKAGQPEAMLKVYNENDYDLINRNNQAFASLPGLQVTPWLGHLPRRCMFVLQWLPGQPLDQALQKPNFKASRVRLVGATLAALHTQKLKQLTERSREAEVIALRSAAASVAAVCPHLAKRAYDLANRLSVGLLAAPPLHAPIHGDFSADQVLLTAEGVTFLDFDRAAHGDPAADLGSFIAQLESRVITGSLSPNQSMVLIDELLAGYRSENSGDLPSRVHLYTAASLLQLAPHPFRNRAPDWPEQTQTILERISEMTK